MNTFLPLKLATASKLLTKMKKTVELEMCSVQRGASINEHCQNLFGKSCIVVMQKENRLCKLNEAKGLVAQKRKCF